jgi:energy-coupling factor transport system ATP-binding protein
MAVQGMRLSMRGVSVSQGKGDWSLAGDGIFAEGIHLVCGDVGSGKTTLALALAGLIPPVSGSIEREGIHSSMFSFQFPEYHVTGLTIRDECISWGLDPEHVLAATRLDGKGDLSPMRLSRGELKRLHLACLLSLEYDLLILDEPFSSLDCCEKERVCQELSGRKQGITILFTHEQMIFPRVDHIWEISQGRLEYRGRLPEALPLWQHAPDLVRHLLAAGKTPANISPGDLVEAACRT